MRQKGFPSLLFTVVLCCSPILAWAQLADYQVMRSLTGDDGSGPQSGLVRGADNLLYGIATEGGAGGVGTIYRISATGSFEVVHTFLESAPQNGINPVSLMRGRDKHLYGTTDYGGTVSNGDGEPVGDGIIYRLNWNETTQTYSGITVLHEFDCEQGHGGDPWGTLIEGPDGALYGMTIPSSAPDPACTVGSTLFKLHKDGTGFQVLVRFDYLVTGTNQFGPLAFGSDGSIFGTLNVSFNPAYRYGSIFRRHPDGNVTYPKVFGGPDDVELMDGARPFSGLVRGVDGAFYGTTSEGGTDGVGTIFRIDESGNFTSLYSFEAGSIHYPDSPLVVGGDGTLYGAAHAGGEFGFGGSYIFKPPVPIGPGGGFFVHAPFDDVNTGSYPYGILGVGADRHLYGTQWGGGAGGQGTLFGLLTIDVVNRPPVPVVMASPNPAEALDADGATVFLSALGSSDADFDDLTYSWTLPDEATDRDEAADHSTISATFPAGTWPVTLTVRDGAAEDGAAEASITVSVTVVDGPPTFSAVANISVPATSVSGANVTYANPTATDIVDGNRDVTCSPPSGSHFAVGDTTVTCTASDTNGNTATTTFVVTVIPAVLINVPADMTVEATGAAGAEVDYVVTATSGAGAPLVADCDPDPGMFSLGHTTVTCTSTDPDTGADASASFDVNVVDTTAPQIVMDINGIEFNSQGPFGALIQYDDPTKVLIGDSPHAVDLVDGAVPVVCNPPPGIFPLGRTHVTCEAVDAAGNRSTFMFDIVVRDADDPVLTLPGPIFAAASATGAVVVNYVVTATDHTSPVGLTVSCNPPSGALFPVGVTIVTCIATDGAGQFPDNTSRTSTGTFVVTVSDVTPPVLSLPAAITVQATGPAGAAVTFSASASDNVGVTTFNCNRVSGSTFSLGTTHVQCTATDAAGNTTPGTFSVTVIDTVGPVVTAPNIVVVTTNLGGVNVTYPGLTAVDLVDGVRPVLCTPPSGSLFAVGVVTTVNCVSTDTRGNSTSRSFTVTVVTDPPTLKVTLSPGVLWPPNHKMVTIRATIDAKSAVGPAPIVTLVSITSNEPDNGLGDGDTANDIQGAAYGTDDRVFQLRAERSGKGNDRVYTVTYKATSPLNASIFTIVQATVVVPHDMSGKKK